MLRACLLVYPFLAVYVTLGTLIFVPVTWLSGDIRPIYWVSRQGVRGALWLSGVRVDLIDFHYASQSLPALFVSNHVSNLEPAALFMVLPRIAVILKKELGRIPLLGYVMGLGGFVYVDRKTRDSRRKALEAGAETLRNGVSLLIFPEGTRSLDGKLLPFRPGPFSMAIDARAPIVPITVYGTRELMPRGSLAIRPGRVAIRFHAPIETDGCSSADRHGVMAKAREVIELSLTDNPLDRAP